MRNVLEPVLYLSDCLTDRPRAGELRRVRRHLTQALDGVEEDKQLRRLAGELRELRQRLLSAFGSVNSCKRCVRPKSDEWPGGHCCSGSTEAVFTHNELAALKLAGTKVSHLRAPSGPSSGCVFRGHQGCSLKAVHRPCLCVRYTCRELEAELTGRGDRAAIADVQRQLKLAFESFCRELEASTRPTDDFPKLD